MLGRMKYRLMKRIKRILAILALLYWILILSGHAPRDRRDNKCNLFKLCWNVIVLNEY